MGFLRQAAEPGKRNRVDYESGDQEPGVAVNRQQNAPTQHDSDYQVCNQGKKKIHERLYTEKRFAQLRSSEVSAEAPDLMKKRRRRNVQPLVEQYVPKEPEVREQSRGGEPGGSAPRRMYHPHR